MNDWRRYTPETTTRIREEVEWTITYNYNATDHDTPRVLLIGDSICNGYQEFVKRRLEGRVNVSFWAGSKCVTDPDYFKELLYILTSYPYDVVCFNNGLHSLLTEQNEWGIAYRSAVRCIRETLPGVKLFLTLSTPLKDAAKTAVSHALNEIVLNEAKEQSLPVIDLFTPMDALDRDTYWVDGCHFTDAAKDIQAQLIANTVLDAVAGSPDK